MNQDIIARGKEETSGIYQCCKPTETEHAWKRVTGCTLWKIMVTLVPCAPRPSAAGMGSLCSMSQNLRLTGWMQAELRMGMLLNQRNASLPAAWGLPCLSFPRICLSPPCIWHLALPSPLHRPDVHRCPPGALRNLQGYTNEMPSVDGAGVKQHLLKVR